MEKYSVEVTSQAQEQMREIALYVAEEPWRSEKIHQLIVENYFVYFWIDGNVVRVTAVVYQGRDQRKQLENMDRR